MQSDKVGCSGVDKLVDYLGTMPNSLGMTGE